ncbi:MAG: DUF1707 domain-containing protein [Geodermatophilaceae bacterium]
MGSGPPTPSGSTWPGCFRAAAGEGMLTLSEADERLAALYASRFRSELSPLTADLPDGGRALLENTVEARSAARTGLRRHGLTVIGVGALLIALWVLSDAEFFWPAWPLAFMALKRAGTRPPDRPTATPTATATGRRAGQSIARRRKPFTPTARNSARKQSRAAALTQTGMCSSGGASPPASPR